MIVLCLFFSRWPHVLSCCLPHGFIISGQRLCILKAVFDGEVNPLNLVTTSGKNVLLKKNHFLGDLVLR